jgi:Sulfatase-modifying factor enzyme 1
LWTLWSVEVRVLSGALEKPRKAGLFCAPGALVASVRRWDVPMSVSLHRGGWEARWRDADGRRRARRFGTEAEARAFDDALAEVSPAARRSDTARHGRGGGVYSYRTADGVRWRFVYRRSDGTQTTERGCASERAARHARRRLIEQRASVRPASAPHATLPAMSRCPRARSAAVHLPRRSAPTGCGRPSPLRTPMTAKLHAGERHRSVLAAPRRASGLADTSPGRDRIADRQHPHTADAHAPATPCCSPSFDPRVEEPDASYDVAGPGAHIPRRVVKGSSHLCAPSYWLRYRPAARQPEAIDTSKSHIGFRCVMRYHRSRPCAVS